MKRAFFSGAVVLLSVHAVISAQVPGRSVNMVSGTTLPDGDPFLQRQNEPSGSVSTRNPLHMLAGSNDYRTVDIPGLPEWAENGDAWLGVFKSFDGGATWRSTLIPGYPQDRTPLGLASPIHGYQAAADPTVRAATNGLFFYSGIAFNRGQGGKSAVFVSRFIDNNNVPGGDPIAYLDTTVIDDSNPAQFVDKPYIAVDIPRPGGPTCTIRAPGTNGTQTFPAGTIYLGYQIFNTTVTPPTSKLMMTRSTDCGATWEKAKKVKDLQKVNQGVQIAIDPASGAVFLTWRAFADATGRGDAIMFARSEDASKLKFKDTVTFPFKPFDQGTSPTSFRTNSYPTIAADGSGRIYIVWSERGYGPVPQVPGSTAPLPGDARVMMVTSKDGGTTWTDRRVVDDDPKPGHQIMPVVTVIGGKVSVVYYDLREDVSKVFDVYVDEANVFRNTPAKRHTLDLRIIQGDPGDTPAFPPSSMQVSEYMMGILSDPVVGTKIEQLQFNVPNLPLYAKGSSPFIGDFIDISGQMFVKDASGAWKFNTAPGGPREVHAFWTDNRDVRPPKDGDWTHYTPPTSSATAPGQVCSPGQTGMRNSNIYTSRVSPGLVVGAPSNTKRLLPDTGVNGSNRRSFVVFAQNNTDQTRYYQFSILNQPVGGIASFLQFSPLVTLYATIAPRSSASRTVYVASVDPTASVNVSVTEIGNLADPTVAPSQGLTGTVTLNPDPTNPTVTNPTVTNAEIFNPTVTNPTVTNPTVTNPTVTNPTVTNPTVTNPTVTNPTVTNVTVANPTVTNPTVTNPTVTNPTVTNPTVTNTDFTNPTVTNPTVTNGSVSDTTWTVTNQGNTAGSFAVKTLATHEPPAGYHTQLLIYKTRTTPTSTPNDCVLKTQAEPVLVANIPNPTVTNPTVTNPTVTNTDITNPTVTNASLWLEAGEDAKVTYRIFAPEGAPKVTQEVVRPDGTTETVVLPAAFNPVQVVAPVVVPETVNTTQAAQGVQTVTVTAPLIVTTTQLPGGVANVLYNATLTSVGGEGTSRTWSLSGGALPAGVTLSAAGVLSGTPTLAGSFAFDVQVVDTASPAHLATAHLVLQIAASTAAQSLTTPEDTPLPIALTAGGGIGQLQFVIITAPQHGTLSGSGASLVYTPAANYNGPDSFSYTAQFATGDSFIISPSATIAITVTPVNDAPVAVDDTAATDQAVAVSIPVAANDTDVDGDPIVVNSVTQGAHGQVTFTAGTGTVLYSPDPAFSGSDSFTYTAKDPTGAISNAATVTVTVRSVPLIITTSSVQATRNTSMSQQLTSASAIGATTWSLSSGTLPSWLTLSTSGLLSGTAPNFCTGYNFFVKAVDSAGKTATRQIFVNVNGTILITTTSVPPGVAFQSEFASFQATCSAGGAPTWTIAAPSLPPGVTFSSIGQLTGTPGAAGSFPFTVTATDPQNHSDSKSFTLDVHAQEQQVGGENTGAVTVPATRRLAQIITAGTSFGLTGVQPWGITSCSPNTTITTQIYPVIGAPARPDESVSPLATATATANGQGFFNNTFTFPTVPLAQHARVAVVLSFGGSGSCTGMNWPSTDYYTNGDGLISDNNGPWTTTADTYGYVDVPMTTLTIPTGMDFLSGFRSSATSVTLQDGRVLLLGSDSSAEIYDPVAHTARATGSMSVARFLPTATLLNDGRVLVAGGQSTTCVNSSCTSTITGSLELFDPAANNGNGAFTSAGTLQTPRYNHTATLLADGTHVLIAGGWAPAPGNTNVVTPTAEVFDASTGTLSASLTMQHARTQHTATLLACPVNVSCAWGGTVLIAGGYGNGTTGAEIFTPSGGGGTFAATTGTMPYRGAHTAVAVTLAGHEGEVLLIGGTDTTGAVTASSDRFDPGTSSFSPGPVLAQARMSHRALSLSDGHIAVLGGIDATTPWHPLSSVEIASPNASNFTPSGDLLVDRGSPGATLAAGDKIIVTGGFSLSGLSPRTAETFTVPTGTSLLITNGPMPDGATNATYPSTPILFSGATNPVQTSIVWGQLPPGLALSANQIDGVPASAGVYSFVIRAVDAASHVTSHTFTITVDHLAFVSPASLPNATPGQGYAYQLQASGNGTIRYSLEANSSSSGAAVAISTSGLVTFTAPTAGSVSFRARIRDAFGQTAVKSFYAFVSAPLAITTTALDDAVAPWSYGWCLSTSGGSGTITFSMPFGTLPYGLGLQSNGCMNGSVGDTGTFTFTARATDQSLTPQQADRALTLRAGAADQQEYSIDGTGPVVTFTSGSSAAQVFTPLVIGRLINVGMPVVCDANLHAEIQGVTGGQPNGTTLAATDVDVSRLAPYQGFPYYRQMAFASPVITTPGTPLAIVLTTNGHCSVVPQAQSQYDEYPRGSGFTGSSGSWTPLASDRGDLPFMAIVDDGGRLSFLTVGRNAHSATLLTQGGYAGLVLLAGGYDATNTKASTELFNPTAAAIAGVDPGRFVSGPALVHGHAYHTATTMPDGSVVVIGGYDENNAASANIERFDPVSKTWTAIGTLSIPRTSHTATLVGSNQILVTGGNSTQVFSQPSTEIVTVSGGTATVASGPNMLTGRANHAATLMQDGRVLVTGGWGVSAAAGAEVYTPGCSFSATGAMTSGRVLHTATLLTSGAVLIAGGANESNSASVSNAELYTPSTNAFTSITASEGREGARAVALADGRVLVAGGQDHQQNPLNTTSVYDPATGTFAPGSDLTVGRIVFSATSLNDGRVLIAGGCCSSSAQGVSGETFDPALHILPVGWTGVSYSATVSASSGSTFALVSGALPAGLSLNSSSGAITGTPSSAGTNRSVIAITDGSGRARLRPITIQVNALTPPTYTATAGGSGGSPFEMTCAPTQVVTALRGRAGDDMDRTELWCSTVGPSGYGLAGFVNAVGGYGGNAYDFTCPAGMVLTGVHGSAGTVLWGGFVVDTMGAKCTNLATGAIYQSPAAGNSAGTPPFAIDCPSGKAVVGFYGGQGGLLDRIGLVCR